MTGVQVKVSPKQREMIIELLRDEIDIGKIEFMPSGNVSFHMEDPINFLNDVFEELEPNDLYRQALMYLIRKLHRLKMHPSLAPSQDGHL